MHDTQNRTPLVGELETLVAVISTARCQMHMHIDKTGEQRMTLKVNNVDALGNFH